METQKTEIVDITQRWELAERLSRSSGTPREALEAVFTGMIIGLETITKTSFDLPLKKRLWEVISTKELHTLQDALTLQFYNRILTRFEDDEILTMLDEHKNSGSIKNPKYSSQLQTATWTHEQQIILAINNKAISLRQELIPQMLAAAKNEGIKLPDTYIKV